MKIIHNEYSKISQNRVYRDPKMWHHATSLSSVDRLYSTLRYIKILQLFGLLNIQPNEQKLNILEPGCGLGMFSSVLSSFGNVFSFDHCNEAIEIAVRLFGNTKNLHFFEADGVKPQIIPEISGMKFNFILLKEFHLVSRNTVNIKPLDIVRNYYNMLDKGGIMIIEHRIPIDMWVKNDLVLQTSEILKQFNATVFHTLCLHLVLNIGLKIRHKRLIVMLLKMLEPVSVVYCRIKGINLSKTIIIRKSDCRDPYCIHYLRCKSKSCKDCEVRKELEQLEKKKWK